MSTPLKSEPTPRGTPPAQKQGAPFECPKCHNLHSGKQGWCLRCGWYPELKTFVELDPWDREDLPLPKPPGKLETFRKLVPAWSLKLGGGIALIVIVSMLARFMLPHYGPYRFGWTIAQLIIGSGALLVGHVMCYMYALMENDRLMMLDIVLKPIAIWIAVARDLPETFWRIATAIWGLTAIPCALIVGGLADKDIWDWGGEPARIGLVQAVADQARQLAEGGPDSLEGAVQQFGDKDNQKPGAVVDRDTRQSVDCLIVGFEPLGDNDFRTLLLAADIGGKLKYVGAVREGIRNEVRADLNKRMRQILRPEPFVECRTDGKWLEPKLVCRISIAHWSTADKLVDPTFKQMLTDLPPRP